MRANPAGQRVAGVIKTAERGHCRDDGGPYDTIWVFSDLEDGYQGFGGYYLPEKRDIEAFERMLFATFAVSSYKELVGKRCFALRHWGTNNDPIVGLESVDTGQRFTIYAFRRALDLADAGETGLQHRTKQIEHEIGWLRRRLAEEEEKLATIADGYKEWL